MWDFFLATYDTWLIETIINFFFCFFLLYILKSVRPTKLFTNQGKTRNWNPGILSRGLIDFYFCGSGLYQDACALFIYKHMFRHIHPYFWIIIRVGIGGFRSRITGKKPGNNCNSQRSHSAKQRIPTYWLKMLILVFHLLREKGSVPEIPEVFPGKSCNPGITRTPIPEFYLQWSIILTCT